MTFRWLEVEGPLHDQWPTPGHRLLFGDLPISNPKNPKGRVEVVSTEPEKDAEDLAGERSPGEPIAGRSTKGKPCGSFP